jgi:HK97 family phage prohead protease
MDFKLCNVTLKAESGLPARTALARISTTSVDRDGDVLLPSGLQAEEYRRNPVVLMQHDPDRVLGRASNLRTTSNAVLAQVQFAERPDSLPTNLEWPPDTVLSLLQQGVLNGFSVGFSIPPGGRRDATAKDVERFGDNVRSVVTRWNLLEFSVVSIPANQDALLVAVSKGLVPDGETVRTLGLSRDHLSGPTSATRIDGPLPMRLEMPKPFRLF